MLHLRHQAMCPAIGVPAAIQTAPGAVMATRMMGAVAPAKRADPMLHDLNAALAITVLGDPADRGPADPVPVDAPAVREDLEAVLMLELVDLEGMVRGHALAVGPVAAMISVGPVAMEEASAVAPLPPR